MISLSRTTTSSLSTQARRSRTKRRKERFANLSLSIIVFLFFLITNNIFAAEAEKIDINTASLEELIEIIHIGKARAKELISLRPFSSLDELTKINGISESRLKDIKDEGLAWVGAPPEKPENDGAEPKITLSFPENNPVNREVEVSFSAVNLKNAAYDLKISIGMEGVISNIYNTSENKWQSSHYYLNNLFAGSSFEETFKLKIREEHLNFQGETNILARVRENGKNAYLEHKEKINLSEPELRPENESLAAISQQVPETPISFRILLIALTLAIFSGITILALKTSFKNVG